MKLQRLLYHSRSTLPSGDGLPLGELAALLEQCLDANPARGVTGLLAFYDDRFVQLLEGPDAAVGRLYERIARDRRHRDMELVLREPCTERAFASWSMAFTYRDPRLPLVFSRLGTGRLPHDTGQSVAGTLAEIFG